ncbi:polyprenyl synthetase family protein [Temperatibacter marinus]|uniref:Octaprenyl diphosphate synthase n=1 Tax=Temperatibacter marinus TaxID=1456591 RepID=A0AA52HB45_9PROT|nr:polyprenyl synthetase family protein [Temperatibacter marinus]WND03263.1 polyprenyl synthetase family protein [Temperatibacter marinus]
MTSNVVSITENSKKAQNAIETLQALVADDMAAVNQTILDRMQSQVALIPQLAGHLIASGGKRLRPLLTLASARMLGYEGKRHVDIAAIVEFIHTATLLHDDVVDESDMRRGKETANNVWGNKPSVLVGDFLFSRSFELMVEDGSLKVLKILSSASSIIAEGEVLQLAVIGDLSVDEDTYLQVIEAKTAALFSAACEVAGVIAEAGHEKEAALRAYGANLGIAFQLIDDALDYSAKQATMGKAVGDDFREGKITLPVLLASRRGSDEEMTFWKRCMEEHDQKEEDLTQALALITKHQTIEATVNRARHYGDKAKDALAIFPANEARKALEDIVDFCIERAY